MPYHNQSQLLVDNVTGLFIGESVMGETSSGSGILQKLTARGLCETTGRRLLKELIKLYPLDALSEA